MSVTFDNRQQLFSTTISTTVFVITTTRRWYNNSNGPRKKCIAPRASHESHCSRDLIAQCFHDTHHRSWHLVAGDPNGIACYGTSASTIWWYHWRSIYGLYQVAYATRPQHCGRGSRVFNWADVCRILSIQLGRKRSWKFHQCCRKMTTTTVPVLGIRPNDQSCHDETWLHLDFVDWSETWHRKNAYEPRISWKERPAEGACGNPKRRISEVMSDNSFSS